jgi:hypothetical protein
MVSRGVVLRLSAILCREGMGIGAYSNGYTEYFE